MSPLASAMAESVCAREAEGMETDTDRRVRLPEAPAAQRDRMANQQVAVWEEPLTIDTYEPFPPERLPIFFEQRVYQGSSGRVYPLPFTERINDLPVSREWQAIHLENQWIRLVLLPELGGRIHIGYDKTNDYDFFYRNNVIKPALVGLAGSWISGGVEFNWPQHHRPATFLPMCWHVEHEDDGAVTVWMSDHDPFARMRGTHGIRIRPDSTLIELRARLHNRTEVPQTFLWWANVAAQAHEDYQAFFPTDVNYVADHARRAITAFPHADRHYYGVDYPALVTEATPDADRIDIYSNIPVPTSYMILDTEDDFFGGYDHGVQAGFVHWADRRIAPGKKLWTWGNSPFGHAWDGHLTDADGPYVELMAGVYTDNQPDFSYLAPGETKIFSQFWYPISGTGPVQQATRDAAVALEAEGDQLRVRVAASRNVPGASVRVTVAGQVLERAVTLNPGCTADEMFTFPNAIQFEDVQVVVSENGDPLLEWSPRQFDAEVEEPEIATEPALPHAITGADELYLTGVHLAQYRHPTRRPEPYWEELLRRDPEDSRANTALGASAYDRGEYDRALHHFQTAIRSLTRRNGNPADGEAHYRLGLVLSRVGRNNEAYDTFAKAAWDVRWSHPAHLRMAFLDASAGRDSLALECLDIAQRYDADDPVIAALRAILWHRSGRAEDARVVLEDARAKDPLDALLAVVDGATPDGQPLVLLDVATDLHRAGEHERALSLLELASTRPAESAGGAAPLAVYLAAMILDRLGRHAAAAEARARAGEADDTYAFPAGLDVYDALQAALTADVRDTRAQHLLGMWLFDRGRHADALHVWSSAVENGAEDAALLRNTALAVVRVDGDHDRAAELYDRAVTRSKDPRLWYERDQLALRRGVPAAERLAALGELGDAVAERNDLVVIVAGLLTDLGRPDQARALLVSRPLQPCEGGEGRAVRAFGRANLELARTSDAAVAVALLQEALEPPVSLGETWHPLDSRASLWWELGKVLSSADQSVTARDAWTRSVREGLVAEVAADTVDAVRSARALGDSAAATELTARIRGRIDALQTEKAQIDYFATSLPEMLLFAEEPSVQAAREREALVSALEELESEADSAKEGAQR